MSNLRTAAKQMLDALEGGADSWQLVGPAIDALKEALAEPAQEPRTIRMERVDRSTSQHWWSEAARIRMPSPELYAAGDTVLCWVNEGDMVRAAQPKAEPGLKPAGVITSMVKGGVTWHIWPDQMPDGTTLYAAAPIIKPEIKEDNSVPQAQQFLYSAWAR